MKEIVLSVKRQKTEIKIFCVCIALAYLMNIISIIAYGTSWSELWTQSLWMGFGRHYSRQHTGD